MTDRLGLQQKLEDILGVRHVYFQPPETLKIEYPAVIYRLSSISDRRADNCLYKDDWQYEVILVDKQPNSQYIEKILALPKCRFGRHYVAENLNHYIFYIYH